MAAAQQTIVRRGVAPVLIIPDVFDAAYCRALIAYFEANGGRRSGAMYDEDGTTVERFNPQFKERDDCMVDEPGLAKEMDRRFTTVIRPAIQSAFMRDVTRVE